MGKIKADILITGDLICKVMLKSGGGKIHSYKRENLDEYFDVQDAVVIDGDVVVDSFNGMGHTVVVLGAVATKGGGHGSL